MGDFGLRSYEGRDSSPPPVNMNRDLIQIGLEMLVATPWYVLFIIADHDPARCSSRSRKFKREHRRVGCRAGDEYNCGSCLNAVLPAVGTLVPPIRIERTTNGLGNRCSIQLSYGGSQHLQLLSLVGWLVSSTKCSRRVPLKVCVKGFFRLRQVLLINRVRSLPHRFRLVADNLHGRCWVNPCPSEVAQDQTGNEALPLRIPRRFHLIDLIDWLY